MAYSLTTSYAGESLLSGFNWFNGEDPSHGYVSYQNRDDANALGLFSIDEDTQVVRLGVDHTNTYGLDEGRPSIRLESKEAYNQGLFIADFLHMPPSQCGLWPAFWSYGSDWPRGGEVDIIEGANTAHNNVISGHTADGCVQDPSQSGLFTGEQRNTECAIGDMNIGCGFNPPAEDLSSYGDGFNAVNGGVYAMQWDDEHIRVWHFARGQVPADIDAKKPDPTNWGLPQAVFGGSSCDVDSYWSNMSLVININFCGDYGNAVWGQDTCTDFAPTCSEYVANNPKAFANAYWDVNYIDAYQFNPHATKPSNESTTTTTMTSFSTTTLTVGGAQTAPVMTTPANGPAVPVGGTQAAPVETAAAKGPVNPAKIGKFSYLGCFGSSSSFPTFVEVDESEDMTLERCVDKCSDKTYAGVFETTCYCADGLDADTRAGADESQCNHACPGNANEFCGGLSQSSAAPAMMVRSMRRRDAPDTSLLTVYGSVSKDMPAEPPAMATGISVDVITTTVCPELSTPTVMPTGARVGGNGTVVPAVVLGSASAGAEWNAISAAMVMLAVALVL